MRQIVEKIFSADSNRQLWITIESFWELLHKKNHEVVQRCKDDEPTLTLFESEQQVISLTFFSATMQVDGKIYFPIQVKEVNGYGKCIEFPEYGEDFPTII